LGGRASAGATSTQRTPVVVDGVRRSVERCDSREGTNDDAEDADAEDAKDGPSAGAEVTLWAR